MSEKIVLTVEQAKAIEELKRIQSNMQENERNGHLIKEKNKGGWISESFKAANEIPFEDFVDALIKGYEVEKPKFKLDDLVVTTYENKRNITGRIAGLIDDDCIRIRYSDNGEIRNGGHLPRYVRHATKEEAFWAELGRGVNEFKVGDVVFTDLTNTYVIVEDWADITINNCHLSDVVRWLKHNQIKGFYPAESFIKFP